MLVYLPLMKGSVKMAKSSYNHLTKEQRDVIEILIRKNVTFTDIGKTIEKDRTTIAKEVKRNRYSKYSNNNENTSNCPKLNKVPYVCNNCSAKGGCSKKKLYYNAKIAYDLYKLKLRTTREGIDITPQEIEEIEEIIVPLIKDKKQSVNQVFANHKDILCMSKTTFYKYIDINALSLTNLDLPKKVKYKKRKLNQRRNRRELAILKNRTYNDYLLFTTIHPRMNVAQMDTVIGKQGNSKVLLTLLIIKTKFMLIFLLDKNNIASVDDKFVFLKDTLGIKLYAQVLRIILTDNGGEFFNPDMMERDYKNNKKICNVFYCDPYQSNQKAEIEKNHYYIRKVFTKGTSFENLTDETVKFLENNINNTPRVSLDNKTPYELTKKLYPNFIKKLNCSYIKPDNVTFNLSDYKIK
jgi:IS30 family transposase